MKAKVLSASVRLLLSLAFLFALTPLGQSPVQASALKGTIAYVVPNQRDGNEIHLIEEDGTGDRDPVVSHDLSPLEYGGTVTTTQIYIPIVTNCRSDGSGSIWGKVFNDKNENSADNEEGGVSGAVVGLYDLSDQLLNMLDNPKT